MRDIIIGDIHGCSRTYDALLSRLRPDPDRDRLILLGDLFDRGPDSWDVLQTVMLQEQEFGDRFVLLRGNHEDYLLQPRLTLATRMVWERVGRQATVRSFRSHGDKMENSVPWLSAHCQMYFRGSGFQCAHAGVKTDPIESNGSDTLLHDHSIVMKNQYAGPLTITGHIALQSAVHFAGDGATINFLPEEEKLPLPGSGVICIDTGCGKGGKLTGMVIENGYFRLFSAPEE